MLRPVLDPDWSAKVNSKALNAMMPTDVDMERLKRKINKMNYVSSYKHDFDHIEEEWKDLEMPSQFPELPGPYHIAKAQVLTGGGSRRRGEPIAGPERHISNYELEYEAPKQYERHRKDGVWTHDRYHKGVRQGKGHEHGWNAQDILARPGAPNTTRFLTSYQSQFEAPDPLSQAIFGEVVRPTGAKRTRCNPMFPKLVEELWGA